METRWVVASLKRGWVPERSRHSCKRAIQGLCGSGKGLYLDCNNVSIWVLILNFIFTRCSYWVTPWKGYTQDFCVFVCMWTYSYLKGKLIFLKGNLISNCSKMYCSKKVDCRTLPKYNPICANNINSTLQRLNGWQALFQALYIHSLT